MNKQRVNETTMIGTCVRSLTRYHWAYGTGLQMNYKKGWFEVGDANKGTWTESTWDSVRMRIFKVASKGYQSMQMVVGGLLTVLTVILTLWVRRRLSMRFKVD